MGQKYKKGSSKRSDETKTTGLSTRFPTFSHCAASHAEVHNRDLWWIFYYIQPKHFFTTQNGLMKTRVEEARVCEYNVRWLIY
ncbi:hypothetical protein CEXT_633811 [Caerostris extrusa]|uniref:Uncharacterized protein n=1 Tax=Caerostris extrusa TaxID=172846 RepID=A0AAV4UPB7_CAEEX|nr:hypothetical protein CEXT_633811 [Caerostris extrusa]